MRRWIFIIIGIVAVVGVGSVIVYSKNGTPNVDTVVAERSDLVQTVTTTGKVQPVMHAALAFERSGTIDDIRVAVGDHVVVGQSLVALTRADILAQRAQAVAGVRSAEALIAQYEAAEDHARAERDAARKGARPEEIEIAERKVTNAEAAKADADRSSALVDAKASVDLANLYATVSSTLQDAFTKANDAVEKQLDPLFIDETTSSPKLSFSTEVSGTRPDAETKRVRVSSTLTALAALSVSLPSTEEGRDLSLRSAEEHLLFLRTFLNVVNDAVNISLSVDATTLASYKTAVGTAQTSVNTALTSVQGLMQRIDAQRAANNSARSTAQASATSTENTLALARQELTLTRAGATAEALRSLDALLTQADRNTAAQRARVEQSRAAVQEIDAALQKTELMAPFIGVVTAIEGEEGEIVSPNVPVVTLISDASFEIETHIPEVDIAKMSVGDAADVTLDAYGDDVLFHAQISTIDPAETIVDGVSTYRTVLHFTEPDDRIRSGMTADVDVRTDERADVIAIPQRAVIVEDGRKFVRVVRGADVIERVSVETGMRGSDGQIEILFGLTEGDRVVTFVKE